MVQAGGVMVWDILSWHTLGPLVPIEHRFKQPQPTWVLLLTMSIPLWLQCTHLLMATSSRITHHVTKLKSSQTGFLNMTMSSLYSNGLHSLQISIPIEHLWDVVEWEIQHHGCAADKSAATAWCYHVNMDQNLWEIRFQNLVESMPQRIKAGLKAKGGPTRY